MRTIASRRQSAGSGRFVGRIAEQQLFRATLRELAALRHLSDEQLGNGLSYAQIFLVAAEGGMGKSTLLRRFAALVAEDVDGAGAQAILLDLERHGAVAEPDAFLRLLHDALAAAGFGEQLEPYREALARRAEARRKAADAEEQLRSRALGLGERPRQPTEQELRAFVEQRLDPEELRLARDPEATTDDFMLALNGIAAPERPLALLIDTYELADRCDRWVRQRLLPKSGDWLVWVIAGREGQPFVRRYEDEFGAGLARGILLDTFARPDIVAYLRQCGLADPSDELIDQLQALSRGVPLALEGWFNLYQKGVELEHASPAAPTTRRAIVQRLTDRFLRYCNDDDRHLHPDERHHRTATRNQILTLMLLRHTDVAALAAAWQYDVVAAEEALDDLADQFSFVFAQEIERQPHALVKEILREWLRHQPALPVALQAYAERLAAHFERQMRERERTLWGLEPVQMLSADERAALVRERAQHQRTLNTLNAQIAGFTELAAPVVMINQRDDAQAAIERIDARLAEGDEREADGPRLPLWEDEAWREALLSRVNALCWAERSGERVARLCLPLMIEASVFSLYEHVYKIVSEEIFAEFMGGWSQHTTNLLESFPDMYDLDTLLAGLATWRLTPLQRAILLVMYGNDKVRDWLRGDGSLEEELDNVLRAADIAAQLLPANGGELALSLGRLYWEVGTNYLRPSRDFPIGSPLRERRSQDRRLRSHINRSTPVVSVKAERAIAAAAHYLRNRAGRTIPVETAEAEGRLSAADHHVPDIENVWHALGQARFMLRQYDGAIAAYQRALQFDPDSAMTHYALGTLYTELHRYEEAHKAYTMAISLASGGNLDEFYRSGLYHFEERHKGHTAHSIGFSLSLELYPMMIALAGLERRSGNQQGMNAWVALVKFWLQDNDSYSRACLESVAGNVEAAVDALREESYRRPLNLDWVRRDPDFDFIRDDPRFQALVGGGETGGK